MGTEQVIISILSPSLLLGIAVYMLFKGQLWTNAAYEQKVKECEKWETAYNKESQARALADAQTVQLLEQAKTTHDIVVAMKSVLEARQTGGTTNVVPLG